MAQSPRAQRLLWYSDARSLVNSYAKQAIRDGRTLHNCHDGIQEVSTNRVCLHVSRLARECWAERRERGFHCGVERRGSLCSTHDNKGPVARPDDAYRAVRMARRRLTGANTDGAAGDASRAL